MGKALRNGTVAPALDIRGLGFDLPGRRGFSGVDLRVMPEESVAVLGPSRSGKSTLLACVLGMVKPRAGKILVNGTDVTKLRRYRRATFRSREIGMVFPDLLPELSPLENVLLAGLLSGANATDVDLRAQRLANSVELPDPDTSGELSGETRMFTAIARALINQPGLLLADEPTDCLDPVAREVVAEFLFALPAVHSCGLLVVTHDPDIAARADQVFRLDAGRLVPDQQEQVTRD